MRAAVDSHVDVDHSVSVTAVESSPSWLTILTSPVRMTPATAPIRAPCWVVCQPAQRSKVRLSVRHVLDAGEALDAGQID